MTGRRAASARSRATARRQPGAELGSSSDSALAARRAWPSTGREQCGRAAVEHGLRSGHREDQVGFDERAG